MRDLCDSCEIKKKNGDTFDCATRMKCSTAQSWYGNKVGSELHKVQCRVEDHIRKLSDHVLGVDKMGDVTAEREQILVSSAVTKPMEVWLRNELEILIVEVKTQCGVHGWSLQEMAVALDKVFTSVKITEKRLQNVFGGEVSSNE